MARGAIYNGTIGHVLAIVDHHGPDLDEGEEGDIREFVEWEQKGKDVVGDALAEAVDGVERVAREGRGHYPFVVRFMEPLID